MIAERLYYLLFIIIKFNRHVQYLRVRYLKKTVKRKAGHCNSTHNDRGNVSGINAKVDFNVFNGDIVAFQQLLVK